MDEIDIGQFSEVLSRKADIDLGNTNYKSDQDLLEEELSSKADQATTYTKTDIDSKVSTINTSINTKANDANVVHKSGDETISGTKTITTDLCRYVTASALDTTRSEETWYGLSFYDKNNIRTTRLEETYQTSGIRRFGICVRNNANTIYSTPLWVEVPAYSTTAEKSTARALTPNSDANDTQIATTAWVNTKLSSVGVQPNWTSTVSFTFPTSGAKYTAPANGIYFCCFNRNALASVSLNINGTNRLSRYTHADYREDQALNTIPLAKGDVIYWTAGATSVYCNVFVPYK